MGYLPSAEQGGRYADSLGSFTQGLVSCARLSCDAPNEALGSAQVMCGGDRRGDFRLDQVDQGTDGPAFRELGVREPHLKVTLDPHQQADEVDGIQSKIFGQHGVIVESLQVLARLVFKDRLQCIADFVSIHVSLNALEMDFPEIRIA